MPEMRKTILRALIFAASVAVVSLVLDLLYAVFYQGGPVEGGAREFLTFRAALHGATLVLTTVGGAVGFAFLRSYAIANVHIAALGAGLGLVTRLALLAAFRIGGFWGMAIWLLAGSAIVAYAGGRLLGAGSGSTAQDAT
jgi:hypothetical protein